MTQNLAAGHTALRRGRWSAAGADYFLTICTRDRQPGLSDLTATVISVAEQISGEGHWLVHTSTIMPDHLHLLVTLGDGATLSEIVRLFKGRLTPALRTINLRWQHAYFEHRVRPNEDRLPIFLYIFLNPYRAKLVGPGSAWDGYYCCEDDWEWFAPLTNSGCAFPEWLE